MRLVLAILGFVLTFGVLVALVQLMLVPRQTRSPLARAVTAVLIWISKAPRRLFVSYTTQDRWLAGSASVAMLLELLCYVTLLIFTFGVMVYGLTDLSAIDALYQSGSTFTTLGIVEPVNTSSAVVTFAAAILGVVVIAIFIGYLMSLAAAYSAREQGIVRTSLMVGEPAWGPAILAQANALQLPPADAPNTEAWIDWLCDLRTNQAINPHLARLRSPSKSRHWVKSILAVMDSVSLRIALDPQAARPQDLQLLTEGAVTLDTVAMQISGLTEGSIPLRELSVRLREAVTGVPQKPESAVDQQIEAEPSAMRQAGTGGNPDAIVPPAKVTDELVEAGLTRADWDRGIAALRQADYPLPEDLGPAWRRFCGIRSVYAPTAQALAQEFHAVPAPWSGDRTPPLATMWPKDLLLEQLPESRSSPGSPLSGAGWTAATFRLWQGETRLTG